MKTSIFKYIVLLVAITIAIIAASFSIFGLMKVFAGSALAVGVMAGSLELGKIIVVTHLHVEWNAIKWFNKGYLLISVIILMLITSLGIYGFLASAYKQTSDKLNRTNIAIEKIDKKIFKLEHRITKLDTSINNYNTRIKQYTVLQQEKASSVTGLIADTSMNNWVKVKLAKNINADESIIQHISKLSLDVTKFRNEQDSLGNIIHNFENSKDSIEDITIDEATELGPIIFIAERVGMSRDVTVGWFIILFIIVFDPLAVALLIVFLTLMSKPKNVLIEDNTPKPSIVKTDKTEVKTHDAVEEIVEDDTNADIINSQTVEIEEIPNNPEKKTSEVIDNNPLVVENKEVKQPKKTQSIKTKDSNDIDISDKFLSEIDTILNSDSKDVSDDIYEEPINKKKKQTIANKIKTHFDKKTGMDNKGGINV